ncbi:hypothetical protein L1049_013171 [Liquidambar formosana]|uniref:MULE transposase domain-containing protein n=1 Tax=Liquidambar formosana TaxID=63359 RepID=A0AAP0RK50_LIQFO
MDDNICLMCSFGGSTCVMRTDLYTSFVDVQRFVLAKWRSLRLGRFDLFYSLFGHTKIMLENDEDLKNMFCIGSRYGILQFDIEVVNNCDMDLDNHCMENSRSLVGQEFDGRETDLLLSYCFHKEKTLLSASWVNLIKKVGQCFKDGVVEFRESLRKYSVEIGFDYDYVRNEPGRVTAECKMKERRGCMWQVHARMERSNGCFYIRELNNVHTCGAALRTTKHKRMGSNIVSSEFVEVLRGKPLISPIEVRRDFKTKYGLDISYSNVWMGIEKARTSLYGDNSESFEQLRWFIEEATRTNPGSIFVLDVDEDSNQFKRFFASFSACINGFKYCRPMLFVDGTFLKSRYKGQLLAATAKDGNQGLFPLAFAVVDSESKENWRWFFKNLLEVVGDERQITFISDRNNGLKSALSKVFPNAYHAYCLHHLKINLRDNVRGHKSFKDRMVFLFRECAYAPTEYKFQEKLSDLLEEGKEQVEYFLNDCPFQCWSNVYFEG